MRLSVAQQEKVLGEGLALGAVMLGIESVNGNKVNLELDFRASWRNWRYSSLFPHVKAGPASDDVLQVLRKSSRRRGSVVAWWESAWPFFPVIDEGMSFDELAKLIHDEIPATAWEEIVRNWLQRAAK